MTFSTFFDIVVLREVEYRAGECPPLRSGQVFSLTYISKKKSGVFMHFERVKALWPEAKGFYLLRHSTGEEYIFLHMLTPSEIVINHQWVHAKEGACILYNKYDYQEFHSKNCSLLHDYFHLSGDLDQLMKKLNLAYATLYYPQNSEQITSIIQQIEQETLKKSDFHEELCALKLQELLIHIARSVNNDNNMISIDSQTYNRFLKLRQDIHKKFDSNLNVEEMASMVNLSPSRFYSIYKGIFGISPKKDYLNIRIEHAKTLLQQRKYSVSQVATLVGYTNQYHFIRQFRELVGVTPGKYLKIFHPKDH